MTVAMRRLGDEEWEYEKLDSDLKWDSHNYVTMAIDSEGHLHLSGNMHCVPLIYFRTTRPWEIGSFERVGNMVGAEEKRCTYPKFFEGGGGELIFTYRDGRSGNGNQIYNVYDVEKKQWRRLLDEPLTDGKDASPQTWWTTCESGATTSRSGTTSRRGWAAYAPSTWTKSAVTATVAPIPGVTATPWGVKGRSGSSRQQSTVSACDLEPR